MGNDRSSEIYHARRPPPKIELERALRPEEVPDKPPPDQPTARPPRRRAGLVLSILLILALAGGGVYFWRARQPTPQPEVSSPVTRSAPPPAPKPTTPVAIPETLSVAESPVAVAARPGGLRYGALRLVISAPEYTQAYLAKTKKIVWAHSMFAKADSQSVEDGWINITKLPFVMTNLPAGSAEVAIRVSGFDVPTPTRRVLIPVGSTAEVEFAATPCPATLEIDCNIKHALVALQVEGEEDVLPITAKDPRRFEATTPSLRPLVLNVSAPGYLSQTVKLDGLEPEFFSIQKIVLKPTPPVQPIRKTKIRYRPSPPMQLDLGDGIKLELVWIPPGEFIMGSPNTEYGRYADEGPQHLVKITQGFWIGRTEVTQAQWQKVMDANPSQQKGGDYPVEQVSWNDCTAFIEKLGAAIKEWPGQPLEFALPSEAEWEYACRAGTETAIHNGANLTSLMGRCPRLDRVAWYSRSGSDGKTHPVMGKKANAWGVYDMLGNVWEWCRDGKRIYDPLTQTDPEFQSKVYAARGGSVGDYARSCRSAARYSWAPEDKSFWLGLRVIARARQKDKEDKAQEQASSPPAVNADGK